MKLLFFLYLLLSISSIARAQLPTNVNEVSKASVVKESKSPEDIDNTQRTLPYRVGKWLPEDSIVLKKYIGRLLEEVDSNPEPLLPVVQEFQDFIENDPIILMLFSSMFTEVPQRPPFDKDFFGDPQVRDYKVALQLINKILRKAPEYSSVALVGLPINAILNWSMSTKSGFAAFLNEKVNTHIKKILNEWAKFLESPESRDVLNEGPTGWLNQEAQQKMKGLVDLYECDPTKEYYGFKSWDHFFTKEFKPGKRPLPPEDESVILNVCESAPYRIVEGVNRTDTFWIKAQPYSLVHMLANDSLTDNFVGGTVYQAFLSPLSYHRWHSPVNGQVVKAYVVEGTYYSEAPTLEMAPNTNSDAQAYLTEVATRALIFIEADNPEIGLICVILIGMAEVSSCDITVQEGQVVKKGDQLGMFHYGGSSHAVIFGPQVKLDFHLGGQQPSLNSTDIPVNQKIASLKRA